MWRYVNDVLPEKGYRVNLRTLSDSRGFRSSELRELHNLIVEHRTDFILAWNEHFGL
jgi:hypothetical protein